MAGLEEFAVEKSSYLAALQSMAEASWATAVEGMAPRTAGRTPMEEGPLGNHTRIGMAAAAASVLDLEPTVASSDSYLNHSYYLYLSLSPPPAGIRHVQIQWNRR